MAKRAVVILSGGLDSATVLALAIKQNYDCFALTFDYGQRLKLEVEASRAICQSLSVKEHKIINLDLSTFKGSALTDPSLEVPTDNHSDEDIPITYVPARNTVFLSIALAWAEVLKANDIFIGVNAVDYSGYPDCRPEFITAFEKVANLATKVGVESNCIKIQVPLINMSKSEIIKLGIDLGVSYGLTLSCYQPSQGGISCGECSSCEQRREGFSKLGISDPILYHI